jgi:CheY-like chemotaxis protein
MRVPGVAEAGDDKKRPSRSLLRDLAHELRDALSPVSASIDLLRVRQFEADTARVVAERVERGLRRAFATLESFALAEQADSGALTLAAVPCMLADILVAARELLSTDIRERCFLGADGQRQAVFADPARTAQVLQSVLLHASIVALPATQIEVRIDAGQPRLRVGCHTDARFEPGEDWFVSFAGPGGGLALRTARRIMELQHGTLEMARQAGECTFVLDFRPARANHADTPAPQPAPQADDKAVAPRPVRLLIVDDNAEVRRAYREALQPLGYAVTEAAEADQALGRLDADAPEVALIDIHLPRINGYRLAQSIRDRMGSAVRLVMLSGMSLDATTRNLSREAGFDDCLDKMAGPLALHALLQGTRRG